MCGIAGDINTQGGSPGLAAVQAMMDEMTARGPDASGLVTRNGVVLGHRRLKIIDLSEASQQPMVDAKLGLSIVYNGAIYNYRELRSELEAKGYVFFSQGDTEVLLKAYHAWGRDFVTRLNGMFALAILERDSGRVVLARDRLGIKPLYWARTETGYRFASSLTALAGTGGVDTSLDPEALQCYLSFHSVVPAPRTILRGIRKLAPGTVCEIEPDGRRIDHPYWDLRFGPACRGDEDRSFEDWQDLVLESLRAAVKRRLVADVPVGVLLSGGLDSSLIVGLLKEQGGRVETFSIGFETVGSEAGDEFKYSDCIVNHFGTRHHKIFVDSNRALPSLEPCVRAMSEPMVSHDNVGFFLLSQEVAKHVKVVQSGQGADEVFAGYHWYPPLMDSSDPYADYRRGFFDRDAAECDRLLGPDYRLGRDLAGDFVRDHFGRPGAEAPVDKALRLDATVMLVDDPVKRVDNHTMAASLEARVPFLDHELVELAARIPARFKVADGGKHVLKEAARRVIPAEVIDRPKGYFPVPALKYLRGDFLELARGYLTNEQARGRGLFDAACVETYLADPESHITPLRGSKLWQAALLEFWLQTHGL